MVVLRSQPDDPKPSGFIRSASDVAEQKLRSFDS